jgi:prepilin peptidase CpaA
VSIPLLFALAFPFCLIWAAKSDILSMTIPNRLTIGLALAFVPVGFLVHLSLAQWGVHLGLGFAGLLAGMVLFALRLMGGGDAKLIAATCLWLGPEGCLAFMIYTALAGGALTLILLAARKFGAVYAPVLPAPLGRHLEPAGDIPYGVAIAAGGLLAIAQSDLLPRLV